MTIKTKFFGDIDVDDNKVITFKDGLPGFENITKFLFMTDEDENSPFSWLQSIEDIDIVFTLFNVFKVLPDYNPNVDIELLDTLGDIKDENLAIYCIATIPPKNVKEMTINLKAPIVINLDNNNAKQVICNNEEYPIKYYVHKEVKKGGE
ncbi:flagellar assembly protein FliW [[Clostridium] colinum]|uniref:flagellar assembly protein FliW n=1 Tax=[Clostridium] colinum TaxID=36835 RepID=UPI0020243A8D|nr:flagellar assembly protein FliW [[Clostridium] colinum]